MDPSKLPVRIEEASNALIARARELFLEAADNGEEIEDISDAMYALQALKSTLKFCTSVSTYLGNSGEKKVA